MEPWRRLGEQLVARRVALGWTRRAAFARDKGLPNDRLLFDLENAKRTNYDAATYAVVEQAYEWATGSVREVLRGGQPTVLASATLTVVPGARGIGKASVVPDDDDATFVEDRGTDDRSPGITDEEVVAVIERQQRELADLLERVRARQARPVDRPS